MHPGELPYEKRPPKADQPTTTHQQNNVVHAAPILWDLDILLLFASLQKPLHTKVRQSICQSQLRCACPREGQTSCRHYSVVDHN